VPQADNFSAPFPTATTPVAKARRSIIFDLVDRVLLGARSRLRVKFILAISSLIILLMGAVTFVVDRHQREALLGQARLRAMSLAKGLAAVSEGYLLSYNFVQLEQLAEGLKDDEEDVV